MSCLDSILAGERTIIGVRNFTECENPESKLYINDLPGFSLKKAADVAPESWQSGNAFFHQCIKLATQHVFDEFAHELTPYFDFANIVETREVKQFKDTTITGADAERGLLIKRWRSETARLFVDTVFIKSATASEVTLKIKGDSTDYEKTVTLEVGLNEIFIGKRFEAEQIKIVFNQDGITTYDGAWSTGSSGCRSCGGGSRKGIYVTGWDGSTESGLFYGVGARVTMQCYEDTVMCLLLPKMYFLLWYKAGILVLQEHINTSRINHIATFGVDKAKEMLPVLQEEYKSKYATLVRSAYEFLRNTKGDCIKVNDIRYVQVTP